MENAEEGMQSFPMGGQMAIKHCNALANSHPARSWLLTLNPP